MEVNQTHVQFATLHRGRGLKGKKRERKEREH